MEFFILALAFGFIFLLCIILTIYIFLRLVTAVAGKEVPGWIYKFGQCFQGRVHIEYDDNTEPAALMEANLFILYFVLSNSISLAMIYNKTHIFTTVLYSTLRMELIIVAVTIVIHRVSQFIFISLIRTNKPKRLYSPANAVIGSVFLSSFVLTLFIYMAGLPAKPVSVQIDGSNVIIGETKASALLADSFSFSDKTADSEIINNRNDHF